MQLIIAALAADSVVARMSVYSDDDELTVISPLTTARLDVTDSMDVEAGYTADVITAATVDIRTAASPRGYEETRHEGHLGVSWEPWAQTTVHGLYALSGERDYLSHSASLGLSRELFSRRFTVAGVYRVQADTVGRAQEPSFAKSLLGQGGEISASLVLDRRTVVGATYAIQHLDGFQSSPYRFVPIYQGDKVQASLLENVPDARFRHAGALQARRAITRNLFALGLYRYYRDNWGVASHTAEGEVARSFAEDRGSVGLRVRGYWQGEADFYAQRYDTFPLLPTYVTRDKKLGRNATVLAGLRGSYAISLSRLFRETQFDASFDLYDQRFFDFEPLAQRTAAILSAGWSATW